MFFKNHGTELLQWIDLESEKFICYVCPKCDKKWGDEKLIEIYSDGPRTWICPDCEKSEFIIWSETEKHKIWKCKTCNYFIKFTYK